MRVLLQPFSSEMTKAKLFASIFKYSRVHLQQRGTRVKKQRQEAHFVHNYSCAVELGLMRLTLGESAKSAKLSIL